MGLFDSLFGKRNKPDIGAQYQAPPQRTYDKAAFDRLTSGYNDLTGTFERRSRGEDMFDYVKFLFEPQNTYLKQQYGLSEDPNDVYSRSSGALAKTNASMNKRGLLDSGTSGLIEAQLRSDYGNKAAELFGNAKQLQRQDIDDALDALHTIYPENFGIADIPHSIAYDNAVRSYRNDMERTNAQMNYEQSQGPKTLFGQMAPMIGQVAGTAIGSLAGPGGAMIGGQIGGQLGSYGQKSASGSNYSGGSSGGSGGFDFSKILNTFGGNKSPSASKASSGAFSGAGLGGYDSFNNYSGAGSSSNLFGPTSKYYSY